MVGLGQLDEAVGRGCGSGEVEQVITVDGFSARTMNSALYETVNCPIFLLPHRLGLTSSLRPSKGPGQLKAKRES